MVTNNLPLFGNESIMVTNEKTRFFHPKVIWETVFWTFINVQKSLLQKTFGNFFLFLLLYNLFNLYNII
jgi:hypothetical protein